MLKAPKFILGDNLNEVIAEALQYTLEHGERIESRNGGATFVNDLTLQLSNPRERHLSLYGRKSNIYQMIAETIWVMSEQEDIDPVLSFFLPRAANYSDDGLTWHGAYGPRMFAYDQWSNVLNLFKTEGINTRRAIIQIADITRDNAKAIFKAYRSMTPKDIPCNRELHFYVTNNELNLKVIQRSGDLLFGAGSINPFEFSLVLEVMYNDLKKLFPALELGVLRWHITNAHIYDTFKEQAVNTVENWDSVLNTETVTDQTDGVLYCPETEFWSTQSPEAFHLIYDELKYMLSIGYAAVALPIRIPNYLEGASNLLKAYFVLVQAYILTKRLPDSRIVVKMPSISQSLRQSVVHSSFTKFSLEVGGQEFLIDII